MIEYYEIDFHSPKSSKSSDAITIRYKQNGEVLIHVIDGGFQDNADSIITHMDKFYDKPLVIHRVIVTHPDLDHTGGLLTLLDNYKVGELWMLRPWIYAEEIIDRFKRFTSIENLQKRLHEIYPSIDELEKKANEKRIPIYEPFQGSLIGPFTVLAPSKSRYLDLIVESEKTPEAKKDEKTSEPLVLYSLFNTYLEKSITIIKSVWSVEIFSINGTTAENEMSVIQYANLIENRILLTGDSGRGALTEAADFAPMAGLSLPGIKYFQVPHHGSRRNVSTDILDRWLGLRLNEIVPIGQEKFFALISAAKNDEDHPRKSVIRAMIHRGGGVATNEAMTFCISENAPIRISWIPVTLLEYPEEQES